MSEVLECPDILEKILVFFDLASDLYSLMQTCKRIRNIVGLSKVWICSIRAPGDKFDKTLEYINIEKVFQLFMSIKLSKKDFVMRPYYGDYYYLYIMKFWVAGFNNDYWSIYSLINNQDDIIKLYKLCCYIEEPGLGKTYKEWVRIIGAIGEKMKKIQHSDKDRILQMIYISQTYNGVNEIQIHISSTKISRNVIHWGDKKPWFPLGRGYSGERPTGFDYCYRVTFRQQFSEISLVPNNASTSRTVTKSINTEIQKIAENMRTKPEVLSDILKIILSRGIPLYESLLHNIF